MIKIENRLSTTIQHMYVHPHEKAQNLLVKNNWKHGPTHKNSLRMIELMDVTKEVVVLESWQENLG